jgi:hypothetical protein
MIRGTDDPSDAAARLLQRAWNRDGLPEIATGIFFLACAGLVRLQQVLPKGSPGFVAATLLFSFGLPAATLGGRSLVKRFRHRWLIARSGYVEPLPHPVKPRWTLALLLSAAAVLVSAALAMQLSEMALLPITGVLGAAICGAIAWQARMWRTAAAGALMLASSVALAFSGLPLLAAMSALFAIQGLFWLLSGAVVLFLFARPDGA